MKTKLLILLLFAGFIGNAQKYDIPVQYEKAFRQNKKEQKKLEKDFDFVLDPIEVTPMVPQSYEAGTAYNWGNRTLGINRRYGDIKERAKRKVAVFIFDTGGDWDHPYLQGFESEGQVFTGEPDAIDKNGHSTHVAGIIGATNGSQELGIARALVEKQMLKGVPYKVLTNEGGGLYSWMAQAVEKANQEAKSFQDQGCFVVYNFSLGGGKPSPALNKVLSEALKMDILIFAASGNSGKKGVIYPANAGSTIAVGATTLENKKAGFSTWGKEVEFGAPGASIASTYLGGTIQSLSGTSMATPAQAALAAIVASVYPQASAQQVLIHLRKHAVDLSPNGKDDQTGYGLSIIDRLLDNAIESVEDPGEDNPVDEFPRRERRTFTVAFPKPFTVMWKAYGDGPFKELELDLSVNLTTKKYASDAVEELYQAADQHFARRYYIIPKHDFLDAAYWAGYFFESLADKGKDFDVKIINNEATNEEGLTAQPPGKSIFRRTAQKKRIQTVTY